ncbi:bicyclomycin resistance protein [Penicillium malachiteum]|uniref:bicyclomycin resistance protein n=1 Tax=Penicillium malachiteum TaxID=1324776 RepID=UPI0025490EBE|nr:bicyclomycin resistance protein [Penicillium malachiteum]KAJ5720403.1 bicyclomycin resistance protein [Penicillium malachiteum]
MTNNMKDPDTITRDAESSSSPQLLVKEKDEEIVPVSEQLDDPNDPTKFWNHYNCSWHTSYSFRVNVSGSLYQPLIVSIWELGEGVGFFVVGPLSERYGRNIVYHVGNVLFILCSVASALSVNVSMLVAFRFINGMAVTVLTLSPSIIEELFSVKNEGKQSQGSQNSEPHSPSAQEILHDRPSQETKLQSFLRPVRLLFSSPVVLVTSAFYITRLRFLLSYLDFLAEIMEETYGFISGSAGLTFLGRAIGNLIGLGLYGLTSDRYLEYRRQKVGDSIPEDRLPLMVLGTALLPVGLFLYGWTSHFHVQWSVPLIGTGIVGFSMLLTKLPTDNYLVDAFAPQGTSASILSADATLKALFGAVSPLLGPSLYRNLGLGWGNSLLAFIELAFLPLFIILWREGQELRRQGWSYLKIMMKRR